MRGGRRPDRLERPAPDHAAERLSAYTYGTVLVLAALVTVPDGDVASGEAALLVVGTGVSTFLAHVFAEVLGVQLLPDRGASPRRHGVLAGSAPILTATSVPLLLMVGGLLGWLPETVALRLAEAFCVARLALTGYLVARYRGDPVSLRTWLACGAVALAGAAVVAVKLLLTH